MGLFNPYTYKSSSCDFGRLIQLLGGYAGLDTLGKTSDLPAWVPISSMKFEEMLRLLRAGENKP